MKIAVWYNLPSGGGKRALHDHIRGLISRGHTIEVWCPNTADRDYLPLAAMVPEHVLPIDWPARPRLSDFLGFTIEMQRSLDAMDDHCRRCAEQINQGGFDILFANSCKFFSATSIGRHVKIPSVLYQQEPFRQLYEAMPRLPWLAPPRSTRKPTDIQYWRSSFADWRTLRNWRLQAREEVDNAAAFTRVLVNSRYSRETLLRAYGLDAEVCYLGIDTDHFTDRHQPREDYVVGLGSFGPAKNIAIVIEALALIPEPRPKLVWIGNMGFGSYLDDMIALAKSRHVPFEAHHKASEETLLDLLNRASMMVYAPRLEPFGLAPLEAGACGVPVIAVAEGGVRETIIHEQTGLVVDSDPALIASAITRLRSDPALARQLGANARTSVQQIWSFEAATTRIEDRLRRYARPATAS